MNFWCHRECFFLFIPQSFLGVLRRQHKLTLSADVKWRPFVRRLYSMRVWLDKWWIMQTWPPLLQLHKTQKYICANVHNKKHPWRGKFIRICGDFIKKKKLAWTFQTRIVFGGENQPFFTLLVEKQASQRDRACTNNLDFHQGNSHIEW